MKRRDFLAASCLAGLTPLAGNAAEEPCPHDAHEHEHHKQLLELRRYQFASAEKRTAFVDVFGPPAIEAVNQAGIKPVGVFVPQDVKNTDLYVLLPHNSMHTVVCLVDAMVANKKLLEAAGEVFLAPKSDPAYLRFESSLLEAFDECPKVETTASGDTRLFQLRIYEAHSVERGQRKIEMFNAGGEIDLFRRCGMNPVFFGEAVIGQILPNLTYMVGFDSIEAKEAGWKKFIAHPEWDKMKNDPRYADTVSNITNIMLDPAKCSQI